MTDVEIVPLVFFGFIVSVFVTVAVAVILTDLTKR